MNPLNLSYVNRLAPYKVWTENGRDFFIETDKGNLFKVGFMDDYSIWDTGAYQFTVNNENNRPSPNDVKLKLTYICEPNEKEGRKLLAKIMRVGNLKQMPTKYDR